MFSKELENLIQATLEDGVLEEYEKAALVKRAQNEGVDLTELEIYINSILQKRKRVLEQQKDAEFAEIEKKKKEEFGKICPACGKQVPTLALNCECGYEFKKEKHESSVKLLYNRLNSIELTDSEIDSCSDVVKEEVDNEYRTVKDSYGNVVKKLDEDKANKLKLQKKIDIIQSFPVPNTKEDIMEFLALAVPNSKTKGGLLGTVFGRFAVGLCILAIVLIVVGLLLPDEHEEMIGMAYGGGYRTAKTDKFKILSLISFFSIMGIILASLYIDKETLIWNKVAVAWKAKFNQVLMKGRSLRADMEFTKMLDYYENQMKQNEIESKKIFGIKLFG